VTIVSQAAGWRSDLYLDDGRGTKSRLQIDASHAGLGQTRFLPDVMDPLERRERVHSGHLGGELNAWYTSISANAIATYGDGVSDWYVCFEDGGDSDFDDEVVHVVRPDFEPGLTALTPRPANTLRSTSGTTISSWFLWRTETTQPSTKPLRAR
jgi:hypothetical protein